jgi:hypothetical protein
MKKFLIILVLTLAVAGCQAPCIFCSIPDSVVKSTDEHIGDLRTTEKELVDAIPDEAKKKLWKGRFAAMIAEARSLEAYAKQDKSFNYEEALAEERKD